MKLKEEWADTIRGTYDRNPYEIFVNPTRKEIKEVDKNGIRWIADSKTKKVYVASLSLFHIDMISGLKLARKNSYKDLPHYESSRWLTGTKYGRNFGSDALNSSEADKEKIKEMLKKNWTWAYKYLPGLDEFLKYQRIGFGLKKEENTIKIDNVLNKLLIEIKK